MKKKTLCEKLRVRFSNKYPAQNIINIAESFEHAKISVKKEDITGDSILLLSEQRQPIFEEHPYDFTRLDFYRDDAIFGHCELDKEEAVKYLDLFMHAQVSKGKESKLIDAVKDYFIALDLKLIKKYRA